MLQVDGATTGSAAVTLAKAYSNGAIAVGMTVSSRTCLQFVNGSTTTSAEVALLAANGEIVVGMVVDGVGVTGAPTVAAIEGKVLTLSAVQTLPDKTTLTFTQSTGAGISGVVTVAAVSGTALTLSSTQTLGDKTKLTFSNTAVTSGAVAASTDVVLAAANPTIAVEMTVEGTGIRGPVFVYSIDGTALVLSTKQTIPAGTMLCFRRRVFPLHYVEAGSEHSGDGGDGKYTAKWSGMQYSGGGYVFKDTATMLRRASTRAYEGTEFYPFAHSRPNADDLFRSGWMDIDTRAMFHDFTVFSPSFGNAYVNVRMLVEVGLDTGVVLPWKHTRMFWMTDIRKFPTKNLVIEFVYFFFVALLIFQEVGEFMAFYRNSTRLMRERKIEARFELRLLMLQHAGFQGLFPYRPRVLMMQISKRTEAVHDNRPEHIAKLNTIGRQIPVMHRKYSDFMKTNRAKANMYDPEEQVKHARELI